MYVCMYVGKTTLSKLIFLHSKKGSTLKEKNFAPKGVNSGMPKEANSFLLE